MASILHKNTILSGNIDFYCLVCESQLRSDDDVIAHIAKPIHKKNLGAVNYVDKFKDDHIRKIKKWYYCEFCNVLLTTAAIVALHLEEPNHKVNKDGQVLKRVANAVIAFDEILIDDKAWNGLVDDTCAICNTEFDKEDIHKSEPMHILNLVQIKIFVSDKNIYRKIDDRTIHCLTCNSIVARDSIKNHSNQPDHIKLYDKCRENYGNRKHSSTAASNENVKPIVQSLGERGVEKSTNNATNKEPGQPLPPGIQKTVSKTENNNLTSGIDKTIDNKLTNGIQKAVENKLTTESKKIIKNKEPVNSIPLKKQTENPKSTSAKKPTETSLKNSKTLDIDVDICERLGAKNYILLDDRKRNWCILCDWIVDSVGVDNHLKSRHHEAMLKLHKTRIEKRNSETKNTESEESPEVINSSDNQMDSSILDFISEFAKKDVDVDLERMSAYCRKCGLPVECSVEIISNHIAIHNSKLITKETEKHLPFTFSTSQECNGDQKPGTKLYTSPVFMNKKKQEKPETDQGPSEQDLKIPHEHEKDEEKKESIVVAKKDTKTVFMNKKKQEKSETETDQGPLQQDLKIPHEHEKGEEKKESIVIAKKDIKTVFMNNKKQEKPETETDHGPLEQDLRLLDEHEKGEEKKESIVVAKKDTNTEKLKAKSDPGVKAKTKNVQIWTHEEREFAKSNNLSLDFTNNSVFCLLCKARVPSALKSMKEHVDGSAHKNNLKINETKVTPQKSPVITKKQMRQFITSAVLVESIWMDIIINDSFVLNVRSFDMITKCGSILRCQVCEVSLTENQLDRHKEMAPHKKAMLVTPVITSLPNEFVREVRSGLYHCGYCNLLLAGWYDLKNHLICSDHREHKNAASWRLRRYMSETLHRRQTRNRMGMHDLLGLLMNDY